MDDREIVARYLARDESAIRETAGKYGARLRSLAQGIVRDAINGFLAKLPEEQRNLFLRRYWYLDSISDIARRFACSESKVKTTLLRCRKRPREHLEEGGYIL